MPFEYQITIAFLLDIVLGDPRRLPHPVRLIGAVAVFGEKVHTRLFGRTVLTGFMTLVLVLLITLGLAYGLLTGGRTIHPWLGDAVAIYLLYTTIAVRDLIQHSRKVFDALDKPDLHEARSRVAMLVSRQTDHLDAEEISRSTVESVGENMVDGVLAPLFFAMLGGPVAALMYKAINTCDSMFGYKNEKYLHFGRPAARLDDLVNFVPARLSGPLIVAAAFFLGLDWKNSWRIFRRDRLKHPSPNSAHSEAAVAGALGIQLGGPRIYFGTIEHKPFIGEAGKPLNRYAIFQVNRLLASVSFLFVLLYMLGAACYRLSLSAPFM